MAFKPITYKSAPGAEPHITPEDDAAIYESIVGTDGVFAIGEQFKATVISNNKVRIGNGVLNVGGHMGRTTYGDYVDMTIENGVSEQNRNDLIIARFVIGDTDTYELDVKKGVSGKEAVDPELVQEDLYNGGKTREYPLYRVKIEGLSIVKVEQMFEVRPTISMLNMHLSNLTVKKTSTQGGWVVEKYVNGWCKLYIKAQVYRASKEQTVYKLTFPEGIRLKNVRIQMTPAQNGWNVANFYHNTTGQNDDNAAISEAVIVFTAKDTTALTYCFDVCVSGFLV